MQIFFFVSFPLVFSYEFVLGRLFQITSRYRADLLKFNKNKRYTHARLDNEDKHIYYIRTLFS